jgi:hypothetical protein
MTVKYPSAREIAAGSWRRMAIPVAAVPTTVIRTDADIDQHICLSPLPRISEAGRISSYGTKSTIDCVQFPGVAAALCNSDHVSGTAAVAA